MKYNLIRCKKNQEKINWSVIRGGKTISEGVAEDFNSAIMFSEQSVFNAFECEKILTKVLMGVGDNRLYLLSTSK